MAEVVPIQILREENGYTVTYGESRPNVRPRRFVAMDPDGLAALVRAWAVNGEAQMPFELGEGVAVLVSDLPVPAAPRAHSLAQPESPADVSGDAFKFGGPPPGTPR